MLWILLDLCHFSDLLALSAICPLFLCPHRKSVFVLACSSMLNNRNGSVLMKTGVFTPWLSFSYCESESQTFAKNPIQNP